MTRIDIIKNKKRMFMFVKNMKKNIYVCILKLTAFLMAQSRAPSPTKNPGGTRPSGSKPKRRYSLVPRPLTIKNTGGTRPNGSKP